VQRAWCRIAGGRRPPVNSISAGLQEPGGRQPPDDGAATGEAVAESGAGSGRRASALCRELLRTAGCRLSAATYLP
jgi:hypothetical protein